MNGLASQKFDDNQKNVFLIRRGCRWRGCSSPSVARAPFALMTHVLDLHCSARELEMKRSNNGVIRDTNELASQSSNYIESDYSAADDQSGWSIIRSVEARSYQAHLCTAHHHFMATNPFYPPSLSPINQAFHLSMIPPPREGPVTKHLRVTAALVLRNLVTYLEEARM